MVATKKNRAPPLSVRSTPVRVPTAALQRALLDAQGLGGALPGLPDSRIVERSELQQAQVREGTIGQDAAPPGTGGQAQLVHEPGGDMLRQLLSPSFTVFEREFRALPEDGMFSPLLAPNRPFQFVLGSYTVPQGMSLWFSDYQNGVLLLDGVNPGDFREAEDGRFSGVLTFDLIVNDRRMADIQYQLDPVPIQVQRQQFDPPPGQRQRADAFDRAAANSFAATASVGLSALPLRRAVMGPDNRNPWTWILKENDRLAVKAILFRPILQPIAAVFSRIAGHKIHQSLSDALVQRLRPR